MPNTGKHETYAVQVAGRGLGKVNRLKEEVARQHDLLERYRALTKENWETYQNMHAMVLKAQREAASEKEMTDYVRSQRDRARDDLAGQQRYNGQIEMRMVEKNKELIDMYDQLSSIIEALPDLYSPKADVYTFDREELNSLLGLDTNTNKPQVIEINDCGTNPKFKLKIDDAQQLWVYELIGHSGQKGVFYTCLDHYHYAQEA